MVDDRENMLRALDAWVRQRPGLEFGNYGDVKSYRAEMRGITRDLHDYRQIAGAVSRSSISADVLRDAFSRAFSGRLSWDGKRLSYCEGQYWPTEYRKAACAVLASALWQHRATDYAPGEGMKIRKAFRREFGRSVASRWFN